jgi:hypothetical protein
VGKFEGKFSDMLGSMLVNDKSLTNPSNSKKVHNLSIVFHHPPDGDTNLKYKL